jgi:hypothetical protein
MAHPDLDQLLNALLPFAQQMLSKHGEFYPFGSAMSTDGKIEAHAAYDGGEQPPSQQLIDLLTQGFRQQASSGKIRAAAICCDVRAIPPGQSEKTDAICVSAEHQSGEAADVYLPYKKGWFGKISYGEIFGAARTREFFA